MQFIPPLYISGDAQNVAERHVSRALRCAHCAKRYSRDPGSTPVGSFAEGAIALRV